MALEAREHAAVVTHALAGHVLTELRNVETSQVEFREALVTLGRVCGYELVDSRFPVESATVRTPLADATGPRVAGLDDVVIVTVLRAATPFVEGLLKVFPAARQGVISASRDESAGMGAGGEFPIAVEYVNLPEVRERDTVIVADPMLATGSTMVTVLEELLDGGRPETCLVLSVVSAPAGLERVRERFPDVELVTVAVDDELDDDGYIVPGLGDAGDRAFGTD